MPYLTITAMWKYPGFKPPIGRSTLVQSEVTPGAQFSAMRRTSLSSVGLVMWAERSFWPEPGATGSSGV